MEQEWKTEVSRGGWNVEGVTASQHCQILRFLGRTEHEE